ncbi:hypothetical protein BDM02DRAFT_3115143 [Thelephora ganbajun]|uniref:Uncharacterized protein n=1 Tax=Thelephora ganbajun TaxID=370292 RepID=A0ACB6ZGE1_THEGA|nr:hypothetical protein BDM02DRAFT_3115143 [Thelephora ganbajun]
MAIGLDEFKYSSLALFLVAATVTMVRLILFRFMRQRQWWWDDFFAFLGLLCLTTFVPGAFLMGEGPNIPRDLRIAAFYIVGFFFYSTIWSARLSIVFTVIRIAPWPSQIRVLLGVAVFFFLQWILLVTQMFWVCEKGNNSWKNKKYAQCVLGEAVGITQVATETVSDLILVVAPLWILRDIRISSGLRIRLIAVFSCSLITTMAGLAHAILVLKMPGALEAIMGAVENCVALSVCNLPVLVPALIIREEQDKFEGTRTGFSFGRQTTFLSTLNTVHMHVEPD